MFFLFFIFYFFFIFADHWGLQPKISLFCEAMKISYGNQMETSLWSCGHTYTDLGIPIAEEVGKNEELKNLLK